MAGAAMTMEDQEERYQALLKEAEGTGNLEFGGVDLGKRSHPRFKIEDTEMEVDIRLKVSVINISLSGVCFFSNLCFALGQKFDFKVGSVFSIQAEVVQCEMVETDTGLMEVQYQILCEFIEQELDLYSLLSIIDR